MEKLAVRIAGEISLSENPGGTMKKWREIFGVTQAELGEYLHISPSTISDYEGNRRKSPGIHVIRRFVDALLQIDANRGGVVSSKFMEEEHEEKFYEVHEFATVINGSDFAKLINAHIVYGDDLISEKKVYGYTIINCIRVILEMPYVDFPKLYGAVPERAFIFTEVSTGRSPLVVIRVSAVKPSIVVLHNITTVDKLAVRIAEKERIPVLTTKLPLNKITEELKRL
ncbi:MAG: helix-turn-helix domain-containing protein [Candidatus Micrarchaeia archaeon]